MFFFPILFTDVVKKRLCARVCLCICVCVCVLVFLHACLFVSVCL